MSGRVADIAENALLHELSDAWRTFNIRHFRRAMKAPVLSLEDTETQLGRWQRRSRTLALSRRLVHERPWGVVLEVLKHEMAHQYCDEVLGIQNEGPHGARFQALCAELGIDGRAQGLPDAPADPERDKVLRRVQRLLALADSPEVHEAQAAMNAAQKLMLKHNLSQAAGAATGDYHVTWLGQPSQRLQSHDRILSGLLGQHFFVRCLWVWSFDPVKGQRGRVLEVSGRPENLEIATWVHGFLLETSERLWRDHKLQYRISGDRDRRRFLSGVMVGFYEKLSQQAEASREEGLVWVGDAGLEDWMDRRYPSVQSARRTVLQRGAAWHHGRNAGLEIVLNKPITEQAGDRGRQIAGPKSTQ